LSTADKAKLLQQILEDPESAALSDRELARIVGCDRKTVARYRRLLGNSPRATTHNDADQSIAPDEDANDEPNEQPVRIELPPTLAQQWLQLEGAINAVSKFSDDEWRTLSRPPVRAPALTEPGRILRCQIGGDLRWAFLIGTPPSQS
jgi:hypothetical protein